MKSRIECSHVIALIVLSVLLAGAARAHHSPAAFDLDATVTLEGEVVRVLWRNPHIYFDIEVEDEHGNVETWDVEGGWPQSLINLGWSRDTVQPGDRVTVTGSPARNPERHSLVGMTLRLGDRVLAMNAPPGTPIQDQTLTEQNRSAIAAPDALAGTWLPLNTDEAALLFPRSLPDGGPRYTELALAAIESGELTSDDPMEQAAASCTPMLPPVIMAFREPKVFEVMDDRIIIRVVVTGETVRTVWMGPSAAGQAAQDEQGLSVGSWDGDALVVSTAFDAALIEGHHLLDGVPAGGATRVVERFEMSDDRRQLAYSWRIENPDYLAEPYGRTANWAWRPDIEVPRLECDPSVARRFQDAF